jgi:hypothetical protein
VKLEGLWELAQSAGWAIPHENICWVSERHHILQRDERGRLHNLTGPACAYPDGWAIYAVHGVRVPEYIIERPQEISVEKIDAENNAEIRRVMMDRFTAPRYIAESGLKPIHADDFGTLYRRELAGDEPLCMVKVVNSTAEPDGSFKDYWLRVDPNAYGGIKTARAAVASTWRTADGKFVFDKPEEYAPMHQT